MPLKKQRVSGKQRPVTEKTGEKHTPKQEKEVGKKYGK